MVDDGGPLRLARYPSGHGAVLRRSGQHAV